MAHSPGPPAERAANGCGFAPYIPKGELGRTAVEDGVNGGDFYPTWPRRGTRLRGRFASSFGQTGVRGLSALMGRAPGALW